MSRNSASLPTSRRTFLKQTVAASTVFSTFAIGGTKASGEIRGANDTIRIAVAGINGRGQSHIDEWTKQKNVKITYLVDPDSRLFAKKINSVKDKGGNEPVAVQDIRKVLDDKEVDAISIATPNHWHSLMTIWGCEAGKDVYVEKPLSHNIHEGRIAVEMAKKHNRIVQHGTQGRSGNTGAYAAALAESGQVGKLLVARGLCYKRRNSIGEKPTSAAPEGLDFNLWLGPAPEQPHHANLVHYNWHWFWDTGNGDIGNQGVHEIDKARWGIPGATLPKSVVSLGGRFGYTDQGQTANTQVAIFDYGETQLIFEVRGLKSDQYLGQGVGNVYHYEAGVLAGGKFQPKDSEKAMPLPKINLERGPGGGHFGNFIAAIRSRSEKDLNAPVLEGHYSSALCHLANISYRLGKDTPFNASSKPLAENQAAQETIERMREHLSAHNLKLDETNYRLGRTLKFDAASEKFVGDDEANLMLTRKYRAPFVVPDKVS